MACDPTTITSAVIATPISMIGNTIKTCITNWWHLEANVEEAMRDCRMYSPVLQNSGDDLLERTHQHIQSLDQQLVDHSSGQSFWGFGIFTRGQSIQNSRSRLRESVLSDGIMHLINDLDSSKSLVQELIRQNSDIRRNTNQIEMMLAQPPAPHIMHRYSMPQVYLETSDYAVGIENRSQRLESLLLDGAGPQLIGLFGMAGVGKSFLAALVCNRRRVREHFRDKILWVDLSNVYGRPGEVLQLQMELFSAFTGHTLTRPFASDVEGRQALCDYLAAQQERYLLVYDNVWKRSVVKPLHFEVNSSDRRTNTKTLVVSRKGNLLESCRYDWSSVEVPPLSRKDAVRLFCKHTFHGNEIAPDDMNKDMQTLVNSCSGIPTLLVVMAKYVSRNARRMRQAGFWKYVISKVHKVDAECENEHDKVLRMMKLSYDDLERDVQQLFLLSASGPRTADDALYYMWVALQDKNGEYDVMRVRYEAAVNTLLNGFLVGVDLDELPLLITELGLHIIAADKEPFIVAERPWLKQKMKFDVESAQVIMRRIRLLETATQLRVMECWVPGNKVGFDQDQLFALPSSLRFLSYHWVEAYDVKTDCLSRLVELRFLRLSNLGGKGMERLLLALKKLSKLEALVLKFCDKVELDLSFLGCMPHLVIVNIVVGAGSTVQNVNHDYLKLGRKVEISWRGYSQVQTPTGVDRLLGSLSSELEVLRLELIKCTKLPSEFIFPNLTKLALTVALERVGCSNISLPRLVYLSLDGCGLLSEMPFTSCIALKYLHLAGLPRLVGITEDEFPSVTWIRIVDYRKLAKLRFPAHIWLLILKALPSLVEVGSEAGLLRSLQEMHITDCEKLHTLPDSSHVAELKLEALPSLVKIGTASRVCHIVIINCRRLCALPSPLPELKYLRLEDVPSLVEFGSEQKLRYFEISNCVGLRMDLLPIGPLLFRTKLPALVQLSALKALVLKGLPWLTQIGSASEFPSLSCLKISECERLAGLPSLPALKQLNLEALPRLTQIVSATDSPQLLQISGWPESTCPSAFPKLLRLDVSNCEQLTLLGSATEFPVLQILTISNCGKLTTLPSLPSLMYYELEVSPQLVEAVSKANFPRLGFLAVSVFKKEPLRYHQLHSRDKPENFTTCHQHMDTWIYQPLWRDSWKVRSSLRWLQEIPEF